MKTKIAEELPHLPEGWAWGTLEECVDILDRQRIPVNAKERKARIRGKPPSELYPYYGATGQVGWIDDFLFDEELVLLGEDGAPFLDAFEDKAYIIRGKSWVNNHAHVLRALKELMLNSFLCHYLNTFAYQDYVTGTTRFKLNQLRMRNIPVPIPPLSEQQRIVSKIEELFARLDAGVKSFEKVKTQLQRYRQTVLKHAFEGKLTEEWRQIHKHEIEPASVLLERIREERGKNVKRKYKEQLPMDTPGLPEIPEAWMWTTIGQLYDVVGGGTPSTSVAEYWNGDVPWITSADIYGLRDVRPRKYVTKKGIKHSATNLVPEESLIVVTRVGLGKIALTRISLCFSQDSQALIGNSSLLYPECSLYYLSKAVQIFKYKHRGTTIAGVTKKQLRELPFPLSPFPEQQKIVKEIKRRFSVADEVEKVVEQALSQSEQLHQSILKSAFEGSLVPQDPTDEPAEKLLERIREQKGKHKSEKKGKKKNKGELKQLELVRYVK